MGHVLNPGVLSHEGSDRNSSHSASASFLPGSRPGKCFMPFSSYSKALKKLLSPLLVMND